MPSAKPCSTRECQEAALAALRSKQGAAGGVFSPRGAQAERTGSGASWEAAGPGGAAMDLPTGTAAPAAAEHQPRPLKCPPAIAAAAAVAGRHGAPSSARVSAEPRRSPGGGQSPAGTLSPPGVTSPGSGGQRSVRFEDEDETLDNLHVGLHHGSRTSSADSLHRSYDEAPGSGELPPSAGGFHVVTTAGGRLQAVSSSARWEDVVGYSRAVKRGPFIFVSGTSAVDQGTGRVMFRRDAYKQTQLAFTIIEKALLQVGAGLEDVVRTRLFVKNMARDGEAVSHAHGRILGHVKPASSMDEVSRLVHEDILVLVEAEAIVGDFFERAGGH
ncbi:endoribonuclease L-PSP [Micractinium conductrix]|uniref:Endoribonuclease L-PSP n=1 Tax=Micractinium conductrix TaxID=554055 RepID=A0A2P6VPL8_9CHLO|nr:endoribonuclease L-PSP [Micractinium conductrix]|eukprot:PSC76007.1 endoribonuclease L-PSP [Micractinium conductrix]